MSHSQIHLGSKITPHGISSKGFVVQTVVHYGVTKFQFLEYVKKTRLFPILFALVILKISLRDLPTSQSGKTDWLIGFYGLDLV